MRREISVLAQPKWLLLFVVLTIFLVFAFSATKKVADSKAPGRCTLKPGQDFDNYKKTSSGSESSPDDKHHSTSAPEVSLDHTLAKKSKAPAVESEKQSKDSETSAFSKRKEGSVENVDDTRYFKYEKNKPELKGPIKDVKQYREYGKEYLEKYEIYSLLLEDLESYRKAFKTTEKGLDLDSYTESLSTPSVMRHFRLKKIFLVVHEEAKQMMKMMEDFAASHNKKH